MYFLHNFLIIQLSKNEFYYILNKETGIRTEPLLKDYCDI